jgi:hypothetical protein
MAGMGAGRGFSGARSNVIFLGEPWLEGSGTAQAGQATYIVLPPQAATSPKPVEEAKPVQPLMMELRGGRFVRVGIPSTEPEPIGKAAVATPPIKSAESGPVALMFRDGHSESVSDYSIIGGRLYVAANYFQSGSWMRTIELSALNLPATVDANRRAGVAFVLPSGPNVVVAHF